MFNYKNLFFTLLFQQFYSFVIAQPPPSPSGSSINSIQSKQNFISLDGGFSIALPQQISGFEGVKPIAGANKGGSNFTWRTPQGFFSIGYIDRIFSPENSKQILQNSVDGMISEVTNKGGNLISKKEISLDGNSGVEVKIRLKEGVVGCTRYFLVRDRMYILSTGWRDGEDGAEQLKILDTFKLIDRKAIIAQKLKKLRRVLCRNRRQLRNQNQMPKMKG